MSVDLLQEAARALRDHADDGPVHAAPTRARVLASLRRERSHRARLLYVAVPLAAALVGSLAWAGPSGLPALWRAAVGLLGAAEPSPHTAPTLATGLSPALARPAVASPAPTSSAALPAPAPSPDVPETTDPRAADAQRTTRIAGASPAPARTAAVAKAASRPDGHALYKDAHQLHFVQRDPAAALGAWDEYLRAYPRGRFSIEAHYNRALCLVRLGRHAEARRALNAFATGAFGGYRQTEARALLEALGEAGP